MNTGSGGFYSRSIDDAIIRLSLESGLTDVTQQDAFHKADSVFVPEGRFCFSPAIYRWVSRTTIVHVP